MTCSIKGIWLGPSHGSSKWQSDIWTQIHMTPKYLWNTLCTVLLLFSHSVVSNSLRPHGLPHGQWDNVTISQSLFKLMSIESVMLSNHLILCHPLLLLPSIFPSIKIFPNVLALLIRWPKYWSFSFSISPSTEYSGFPLGLTGLISLFPGTLKSLLQHHSWKASFL